MDYSRTSFLYYLNHPINLLHPLGSVLVSCDSIILQAYSTVNPSRHGTFSHDNRQSLSCTSEPSPRPKQLHELGRLVRNTLGHRRLSDKFPRPGRVRETSPCRVQDNLLLALQKLVRQLDELYLLSCPYWLCGVVFWEFRLEDGEEGLPYRLVCGLAADVVVMSEIWLGCHGGGWGGWIVCLKRPK